MDDLEKMALEYHSLNGQAGKVSVVPTKPCKTAQDLSYAYTPGVAKPVLKIAEDVENAYKYTSKGNLVAVISNGTAILGLGDKGPLASKPVMEGKGVLFKRFADIDVFDIEVDEKDPVKLVEIIKSISLTFGGINLEDIKGPECFYIENELIKQCNIPVFHDDQHGTAIIATAGLLNSLELVNKNIEDINIVINGAGAAGISCGRMFVAAGVKKEHIFMCDSKGLLYKGREGLSKEKLEFVQDTTKRTLTDALVDADVLMGLSVPNCVSPEMLLSMAKDPIVFAMCNPDPEIDYELAKATRADLIMATGRSDYPNQINNVLGFPFIFRGALDSRATRITENMKMAAAIALAELAKEEVAEEVVKAYGSSFTFSRDYIVPKPFDPRVIERVAVAVAKAAEADKVALYPIKDYEEYKKTLRSRMEKYWN